MKILINKLPIYASYAFILLFTYAAVSKMRDFENFQVQLAQSPLLSAYAGFISYGVIVLEVVIAGILLFPKARKVGLYASFGLMVAFTVYIYLILNYSDFVPCSCGGILEKMSWDEHLIFNAVCVVLALTTSVFMGKERAHGWSRIAAAALIAVFSAGSMVALFLSSEYIMKKENNFTRRFLLHPVMEDKKLDLGLNSYYFAGVDDKCIYLGNSTAPLLFTKVDTDLFSATSTKLTLDNSNYKYRYLQLLVKAPFYYLCDGSVPIIYRSVIGDSLARTISYDDAYFTQIAIADTSRFVLRTRSRTNLQYTIALLDLVNTTKIHLKPEILEKQIDGVFDVDGKLIANQSGSEYVYTYTYRNQFLVMDSSLATVKRLNTIDTTTIAKISQTVLSNGIHKMDAPPLKVNLNSTFNGSLLFNESNLMGKNESRKSWQKASIVDVYHTEAKEYIGSFYIYNKKDERMSQMMATDEYLYVLIGNELIRYRFRDNITKYYKTGEAENLKPE